MPTYQYACTACQQQLEVVQAFSDAALSECPACSGRLRKVYGAVGVVFKGSGFYKTDSRAPVKAGADGGSSGGSGDGASSGGAGGKDAGAGSSAGGGSGSGSGGSGSGGSGSVGSSAGGSGSGSSSSSTGSAAKSA